MMSAADLREFSHDSVLRKEAVQALNLHGDENVVDATYGRGGHSEAILSKLSDRARLIVVDRDQSAIDDAFSRWGNDSRVDIVHAPFSCLREILMTKELVGKVNALLFDFGVSSPQLDDADRGFSFSHDGPLDMRMDPRNGVSAAKWLQDVEESELIRVLKRFGEERFARRIAVRIKTTLMTEEISTTGQLASLIRSAVPTTEPGKHPATRSFQAIRIAVNNELGEIESVLPQVLEVLAPGGRVVMISFHSLEDRLVKRFFKEQAKGDPYPPDLPVTNDMLQPRLRIIGKPIRAGEQEVAHNRRARSAIMRVAEKVS